MFKAEENEEKKGDYVEKVENWGEASVRSTIPRLTWKEILGKPLNQFILDLKTENVYTKDELLNKVLAEVDKKDKEDDTYFRQWTRQKVIQNIKIRISSVYSEMDLYKVDYKKAEEEEDG